MRNFHVLIVEHIVVEVGDKPASSKETLMYIIHIHTKHLHTSHVHLTHTHRKREREL